jgi:hypothetical protein
VIDWDGTGHPPGYLQWAWESASPSLRVAALQLPKQVGDDLVVHVAFKNYVSHFLASKLEKVSAVDALAHIA